MQTLLKGAQTEVSIGRCQPIAIIGNRIDPANPAIVQALYHENMDAIGQAARSQVRDGAHILNINVRAPGVEEQKLLPMVIQAVASAVDLPIAIDVRDPAALHAALACCPGRPLVNAISYSTVALKELLPLAVRSGAAVVGLAQDDNGTPTSFAGKVELGREILRQCITAGVARQDVIVSLPVSPLGDAATSALPLLDALAHISRVDDVNLIVSPHHVSHGLPQRDTIDAMFSALAIRHGATCLIVDPLQGKRITYIANVLLGKEQALTHLLANLD